jgi:hypothetical protein
MNKILDFIFENIKSTYVLGAISIISAIIYFTISQQTSVLIIFIISIVFFAFALGHHIYTKIKQIIQAYRKKIQAVKQDYKERFDEVVRIYESLDKKERKIYYDLFHNKEKVISASKFYFGSARTRTFSEIAQDPTPQFCCGIKDCVISCRANKSWSKYYFTMDPTYREQYKDVIEDAKHSVEENE